MAESNDEKFKIAILTASIGGIVAIITHLDKIVNAIKGLFPKRPFEDRIMTEKQVAKILKVNSDDVITIIEHGQLKARKINDKYRIRGKDILNYLKTLEK